MVGAAGRRDGGCAGRKIQRAGVGSAARPPTDHPVTVAELVVEGGTQRLDALNPGRRTGPGPPTEGKLVHEQPTTATADYGLARRMWHQLEPVHAVFWYAPEVFAEAAGLG